VCNLLNSEGEVLSIVGSEIGAGPFSVVLNEGDKGTVGFDRFPDWIEATSPIRITPELICLGDIDIDVSGAKLWDPSPEWSRIRRSMNEWLGKVSTLKTVIDREAPDESLYHIVDLFLSDGRENQLEDTPFNSVQKHAIPAARILLEGIASRVAEKIEAGAHGLAGLGGGLTPAGDDFIVGILLGLRSIPSPESLSSIYESILNIAIPRTNALSAAWLQAAAKGNIHELWHQFFDALVFGSTSELQIGARRILAVGHSSGADALAGFVLILESSSA
jgi:hypothetical protein